MSHKQTITTLRIEFESARPTDLEVPTSDKDSADKELYDKIDEFAREVNDGTGLVELAQSDAIHVFDDQLDQVQGLDVSDVSGTAGYKVVGVEDTRRY